MSARPLEITSWLQGLRQRGCLVSDNQRRWSQYRLEWKDMTGPLFSAPGQIVREPGQIQTEGGSSQVAPDSTHLPGSSIHLGQEEVPGLTVSDQPQQAYQTKEDTRHD